MDFFEKIGTKVSNAGQEVIKKTKDVQDARKIKTEIERLEGEIENNYLELGKLWYKTNGEVPGEPMQTLCSSISDAQNQIEELKKQL